MTPEEEEAKARDAAHDKIYLDAADKLKELMKQPDVQQTAFMILVAHRLIHWAVSELTEVPGMSTPMVDIAMRAQEAVAGDPFKFVDMIKNFRKQQMPWLEAQQRRLESRNRARERRIRELQLKLRRTDIPLPYHSMRALFGDDGFTHEDCLTVFGPRAVIRPLLRLCAKEYQRVGGLSALLYGSDTDGIDKDIAELSMPPAWYLDAACIQGDLVQVLEPVLKPKRVDKKVVNPAGLLVIEDLDQMYLTAPLQEPRSTRLGRAHITLRQMQANNGIAMLIGIETDNDVGPGSSDVRSHYPEPIFDTPHIQVALQKSEVIGGGDKIVVGNDVDRLDDVWAKLSTEEK